MNQHICEPVDGDRPTLLPSQPQSITAFTAPLRLPNYWSLLIVGMNVNNLSRIVGRESNPQVFFCSQAKHLTSTPCHRPYTPCPAFQLVLLLSLPDKTGSKVNMAVVSCYIQSRTQLKGRYCVVVLIDFIDHLKITTRLP